MNPANASVFSYWSPWANTGFVMATGATGSAAMVHRPRRHIPGRGSAAYGVTIGAGVAGHRGNRVIGRLAKRSRGIARQVTAGLGTIRCRRYPLMAEVCRQPRSRGVTG